MSKLRGKKKLTKGKKKKKVKRKTEFSDDDEFDYQKAKIIEDNLSEAEGAAHKKGKTKKERE